MLKILLMGMLVAPSLWASQDSVSVVEVQWVICEPSESILFQKLQTRSEDLNHAERRKVYYTETENLDLYELGAVARTRDHQGKMKTAIKVSYQDEGKIPWSFLDSQDFKCEQDSYIEAEKVACSLYFVPKDQKKLISAKQEEFLRQEVNFKDFEHLKTWGPVQSQEWSWTESSIKQDLVVESLRGPDSYLSIELSARVPREKKAQTTEQIQVWLQQHQVVLCPQQQGKTGNLLKALINTRRSL